jgi:hypothetical protein
MSAQLARARRVRQPKRSILSRIFVTSRTGCWLWTGAKNSAGYPVVRILSAYVLVHRFMLSLFLGRALRDDHDAHHLTFECPRHCVNPLHLQEVDSFTHRVDHFRKRRRPSRHWETRIEFARRYARIEDVAAD